MANPLDPIYVPMVRNSAKSTGTNSPSSYASDMRSIANEFQDMLTAQADKNNAWSAEQAAKQMDFQRQSQQRSMDFNSKEAAKNRDWQKMMSDTAHQREVRDLIAAGLNPILAVNGGNGAPVGSGATASSTGSQSGAKGDTDTSANAALVSLMSAVLNQRTQLEIADTNAKTNLAVAEKYNAITKYLGELQNSTNLYLGERGLSNSLAIAGISASASRDVAGIHAAASEYAADQSRAASQYATNVQSWTSRAVAEINKSSHIVGQQISSQASKYAADVSAAARRYETNASIQNAQDLQKKQQIFDDYVKKHYPSNVWQAISGMAGQFRDLWNFGSSYVGQPSAGGSYSRGGFGSRR